jgi:hypothetical protein
MAPELCTDLKTPNAPAPAGENSMAAVFTPLQKIDDLFIVVAVPAVVLGCISALARAPDVPTNGERVRVLSVQVRRAKG